MGNLRGICTEDRLKLLLWLIGGLTERKQEEEERRQRGNQQEKRDNNKVKNA